VFPVQKSASGKLRSDQSPGRSANRLFQVELCVSGGGVFQGGRDAVNSIALCLVPIAYSWGVRYRRSTAPWRYEHEPETLAALDLISSD
jgi:hypothetical protein